MLVIQQVTLVHFSFLKQIKLHKMGHASQAEILFYKNLTLGSLLAFRAVPQQFAIFTMKKKFN